MKKLIIFLLITTVLLSLTSCYSERGYAYRNLNNFEPGKIHSSYTDNDSVITENETVGIGGNYDNLNKLGCNSRPHCCGHFTSQEIWYKDLENRAIVEKNIDLCYQIPESDLVVNCPNEEPYSFYSRKRCLSAFEQK